VPADLLTTSSHEWMKATEYGIGSFQHEVDVLYLVGFSTGATLELNYLLRHQTYPVKIAGLIMLSPALAINATKSFFIRLYRMFRWLIRGHKWILKPEVQDYTKYTSFPVNAAFMLQRVIVENKLLEKKRTCNTPLFIAATADDETVQPKASLKLLSNTTNPKNRMIYYSNERLTFADTRIQVVKSANPDERILSFSHVAIPISPDNPHYGRHGDYQESIYEPPHPDPSGEVYRGAFNAKHEKRYRLCRLTYNPLFSELMQEIDAFIADTQMT
jgi:esterase/lipase